MFKKTTFLLVIALLLCLGGFAANAEGYVQFDPALNIPFMAGIHLAGMDTNGMMQFAFLFPELGIHYVFDLGALKIGVGARMFTFIVENILYPNAFAELDLGMISLNASLGGGALFLFGLVNTAYVGEPSDPAILCFPDISAELKATEWFRIGVGCWMLTDLKHFMDNYAYFPYVKAHFRIAMKNKN